MTNPKMKPCPRCKAPVDCWSYESGSRRVECNGCDYIGPIDTSVSRAIKRYNAEAEAEAAARSL